MSRRAASLKRAMKMRVVYIAGPYTATAQHPDKEINVELARTVAQHLWSRGFAAVCPHLNTLDMECDGDTQSLPHHRWIEGDIAILSRCDTLVVLPGWEASHGATQEVLFAVQRKITIHYWPDLKLP